MGDTKPHNLNTPASRELAAFIAGLSFDDLPNESVRLAERCFVDTVGVTAAGAIERAGEKAAITVAAITDRGSATLLGHNKTASPTDAAFANGTAAHCLDFDDVTDRMSGHPSVTLVPPIFAAAEVEDATGQEVITAYVAGFEAICYLGPPILPSHYEQGWHATATLGSLGAAAATANLLGLSETEARHAINIAASTPAGLKRNIGTMTKPMHAGQASRSGLTAALLAAEGFTAAADALDGPGGFSDMYSGNVSPTMDAHSELGERWATIEDGVGVKKYPCCYFTHTSIVAAANLTAKHNIEPSDIGHIRVYASQGAVDALTYDNPKTGFEAKFSMPYVIGAAISLKQVDLTSFEDTNLDDPAVQQVRKLVDLELDTDLSYDSHQATVTITTTDGRTFEQVQAEPPGTHENPLSNGELQEKFMKCATRATDDEAASKAYAHLNSLRDQDEAAAALRYL